MLYNFLTKEQCQDILTSVGDPNDEDWKDTRNSPRAQNEGFFYKYRFFDMYFLNSISFNLLKDFFPKVTNLYMDEMKARILYLKKGENLPLHNFNYKTINDHTKFQKFLKECDFHGYLFLNSVEGSKFILNGSELDIKQGTAGFFNITDKGKFTKLENDLYVMMIHIKTNTKLYDI